MEDLLTNINDFFDFFLSDGEGSVWVYIQAKIVVWFIQIKIWALQTAWAVARIVLETFDVSSTINNYWGQLDSSILYYATLFNIPDAINLILNAHVTRFILRFF